MDDVVWLRSMETDPARLKREATKRRKSHEELAVPKALAPEYQEDGREIAYARVRKVTLKRPWPHDKWLENRAWLPFYLLGYPEVSQGSGFKVRIDRKGADPLEEQIDVLAKDDETVVVAECKSAARSQIVGACRRTSRSSRISKGR